MAQLKDMEMNNHGEDMSQESFDPNDYMAQALDNMNNPKRGDVVDGTIVQVGEGGVLVDIGAKSEALIPVRELACYHVEKPSDVVKVGDKVTVVVVKIDDNEGRIICSRQKALARNAINELEKAFTEKKILEGKVIAVVKGGVLVDLGVRAFLPASHLDTKYVDDIKSFVGQTVRVRIIEFDQKKPRIVLSRKEVLVEEEAKNKEQLLGDLEEGQVVKGTVKRLTGFGAFVDLGGIDGLLHVSEMAWHHVKHPSEIVSEGQELEVQILAIDKNKDKISLGLKQIVANPWDSAADKYTVGRKVTGTVVRLAPFGAFVQLERGVDGLIHLSQLSDKRVAKADEVVKVGQELEVKVLEVKPEEQRISLSLKEAQEDVQKEEVEELMASQPEAEPVTIGDAIGKALTTEDAE